LILISTVIDFFSGQLPEVKDFVAATLSVQDTGALSEADL
jgi:hypothetical protein